MQRPRCLSIGLFLVALTAGWAVERLPIEDFAREPGAGRARLSPDGKLLAFVRDFQGRTSLHIAEIDKNNKLSRLDVGEALLVNDAPKEVENFVWIGDRRLLVTTTVWDSFYGVIATNWDGGNTVPISGYEDNKVTQRGLKLFAREMMHAYNDKDQNVLMLDRHEGGAGSANRPDILRVNTVTGLAHTEVKNPGEVARWGLDFEGTARFGVLSHGEQTGAIYRESAEAAWRTILPLQNRTGGIRPLGFDRSTGRVLVAALTPENRWTVYPLDPATGAMGEPLLSDPEYDVVLEGLGNGAGVSLAGLYVSRVKQSLMGLVYYREAPRVKWFDKEFAGYQAAADRSMPDTVNLLAGASWNEKRLLWYAASDQNPGAYFLMDLEKHSLKLLASRMSWIKPTQMAPMLAIKYQARDGLVIHGYLTVPVGHEPKKLPLVVLVHGGPWVRDTWGFDPLVQLLANRGYAVLQVNYRGSPGYGEELFRKARRQIGREIQDDIEDATRWALAAGVADPEHIAIMGPSYGGYSALFALGHNPELYRCGISLFGVTDWPAIFDGRRNDPDYKQALKHWRREIGDPERDRGMLEAISPVNFAGKITAPVLLVQGRDDHTVPQDQARRMVAALDQVGRKPESLFLSNMGHNYGNEKQRTEIFRAVVAFLEKNLGPGVP